MKIAVLSDTHWQSGQPLPQIFHMVEAQKPDLILHAGDWTDLALLPKLQKIAGVEGVLGNCDKRLFSAPDLGYSRIVQAGGVNIGLTHGHLFPQLATPQSALRTFAGADVQAVVFGHSHVPLCQEQEGILLFNPGSASRPLGEIKKPSFGLLTVEEGKIQGEIIYLLNEQ